ncbi:MerR family transcriptional regulator [Pseudomonas sp. DTU12.3]|uniref:DNA-binding transcriptional regulator, MerR family n=1 Tax=Pseudomonas helmanticensis TaxID=1471381 RepID=A0ACD2TYX4_9PSED|nr:MULTISPECIES: MerR family transcriptional regulator [Pseudomonas]QAX86069.1 MerR family transcriptional regulator [Pseudomonas sp. DTU12.3]SMQ22015.1 DNA-binding transcriptional regulator, MerR family [Pseudomonas helmanticensis]
MKIGEVSKRTGVAASAIRYYEEQGLVEPSTRDANGYRHYGEAAVARLILVRDAQRLGFSLDTIRGLFLQDGSCSKSLTIAQIDIRLDEIRQIEANLALQSQGLLRLRHTLEESLRTGVPPVCASGHRAESYRHEQSLAPRSALPEQPASR